MKVVESFEEEEEECCSAVIRGLRSERLFYEAGETRSSSILDVGYKKVSIDSKDPHADFRSSMEEMVEAHAFNDWEELLSCYLRANDKSNHSYIIAAFIDLLLLPQSSSSSSSSFTFSHSSSPRDHLLS